MLSDNFCLPSETNIFKVNTETRFYFLLSFDESYSLDVINATEVKNNIPVETALGSGTIDNLQTFLKYPFPLLVRVTFFNAGQPTKPYLLMNHYTRKVNFKFLMRNCCIHIIKQELLPWILFLEWISNSFSNAHSLIQLCLLHFEADVWRKSYLWL